MKKSKNKKIKIILGLTFLLTLTCQFSLPIFSYDTSITPQTETKEIPTFNSPVCLLVGLNSNELSYREISTLAGFELLSVPYRSDIKLLTEQIKPAQIIIKHPSGFTGLYSTDGQLIRGVQTINGSQVYNSTYAPPSIIQPIHANPTYEDFYYPSSQTGTVPHGGLNNSQPPKGRGIARHLLKLSALAGLIPFQYPGYFMAYSTYSREKLFPALAFPNVPLAIGAASSYADSTLDGKAYDDARPQPRDYMFQPVIEGY